MTTATAELTGDFIDEKCPKCGSQLLGNEAGDKWCSFVGGRSHLGEIPACDWRSHSERETAKQMVSLLRSCPASPERAKHILRMVRIAEGNATASSFGTPFCDAAAFCEANGVTGE